ncbi:hypothetical protein AXG93_4620s1600 [Marchantia polymorpha subsp. ruderalis]|uniref:C-terminal of Roc (COR) domain-containing protein n=1 Tax=Marchantia polymorpha subsp. ruderalis TaxID=1480154 RepID=A0A176VYR7_MARPO|nr:hypothetical protein AXG93_4620s1600 [Marchantia polymorpha subsp. ruderalis]
MEGAGASIVSDAAQVATGEMDSAEEEPEESSGSSSEESSGFSSEESSEEVEDFIRRLEGKGKPITQLKYGSFWTRLGPRSQMRLRVLKAIGNCNTLEYLDVASICGGHISTLTASEWDVVLSGFRCSNVLRVIRISALKWSSDEEVERLCLELGRILNTSTVAELEISFCRLSARCFLNLASEMRGTSESKLQQLVLHNVAWTDSSAWKHVAAIINSATRLETLSLGNSYFYMPKWDMDEEFVRTISEAINQRSSLKKLTLSGGKRSGASDLLRKVFTNGNRSQHDDDGNRSIEHLEMCDMAVLGNCVRDIFICKELRLKKVTFEAIEMTREEWRVVGESIRVNTTVKTIEMLNLRFWEDLEDVACAASSDDKDPIMEVSLQTLWSHRHWVDALAPLNFVGKVLRGEIKSIKSLEYVEIMKRFSDTDNFQERLESIFPMNRTSDSSVLKSLSLPAQSLENFHEEQMLWKQLFLFLRGNTTLTHLTLADSWGLEWPPQEPASEELFRDLMSLLQVNLSLQEIDVSKTSWAEYGKAAQIQEALQQNKKRAEYMSVFREAKLEFGHARAGRLFLCGSPRAGKTQLRRTFMKIVQNRSWLWDKLKWRTRGIEVEFFKTNDESQISIWDLGGQGIFRTLQNVLFSPTSNFCVFIFVYSPFPEKEDSCLEAELEEWLSFISSSTSVTGHNRPQVLVVISHKDKTKFTSLEWACSIVNNLTKRFAKFVDLHPIQEIFYVDARKKEQVIFLKDHIFETFKKMLSEKSPLVPQLCSELSSRLVTKTKENRSFPLWSSKEFNEFCAPSLKKFIPISLPHTDDHSRILKSIISYLNDVGSIVSIPNLDYIVVDPNWLTNTLLGELVALGQNFHARRSRSSRKRISRYLYKSPDGFVTESVFARLIEEFLGKQPHGARGVDRELIENILINLDLCFKLEDSSQYFIPSFIPEHPSKEEQKHQERAHVMPMAWETLDENPKFVGIRVQCQDARTMSLTAAFFPCFQMFMRRKLISEMHVSKETVTCSRNYLQLFLDGHEIYVEQETSHKYLDVRMLCSKYKSREESLKYLMKNVVQELISFCASPKGCPGVALVLGVIQTICVEKRIPTHLRGAILIEDLKSDFIHSIEDKLEGILLDISHLEKEDEFFNYEHPWPLIEGHTTQRTFERARELLGESNVEAVVEAVRNMIRQKRMQQLESLGQGLDCVNNDLVHSHAEDENMDSKSNFPDMKDNNRPSSRCSSRESTIVEDRSTQLIMSKIDQVEGNLVQRMDEGLRSVVSGVRQLENKVGQIITLQQELQSTLNDFNSKVDSMIQYSESLKQARTPKRPYVTNDVGVLYKLSAGLHFGTTVRLHLMCESITEPEFHMVKDQEGLKIRLDWEDCKWIRKTVEIMYKVMYYAAKAGLAKTVQLGQAIPDWADLTSDIVKLVSISNEDRRAVLKGGEKELQEAWLRIQQTLAPHLQNRYSELFKLYQVKYDKAGHAWVCEKCMKNGLRSGVLTC